MGLFDHLFKPRPDLESIVEAPLRASGLSERRPDVKGEVPPDPATAFLQPKGYAPGAANLARAGQAQGFVPVLPHAKRAVAPERKPHHEEDPAVAANLVVLTLGDVMGRIPVSFLRPGAPDLKRELRFHFEDLAADITRGRPAIALSCIADQCPDIFRGPISEADDMAIRLPLQKLVEQAARLRPPTPAVAPFLVHPPARPPAAAPVEKPQVETPAPVQVVPVAPVAEKMIEPVVPVTAPTPPVAPPPPVLVVLPPPVVNELPPAPEPPIVEPERAPLIFMPEPVAEMKPPQAAEPEPVRPIVEPEPIAEVKPQAAPEPPINVAPAIADEPQPAPEPARPAKTAPLGNEIELSLAALVAKVPREMIGEPLPRIDESLRITLPFPMIERQLGGGKVEIPARLFWTALPPLLKHYFVMRDDQILELPLEEIFQNLPVGGAREKVGFAPIAPVPGPTMEREAPIVLAPVPEEPATPELDFDRLPTPPPSVEAEKVLPPVAEPAPVATVVVEELAPSAEPAPVAAVIAEEPVKIATPEPAIAVAPEPPVAPEPEPVAPVLAELPPVDVSAVNAAPEEERPALVNLQPFRVFAPPSLAVEPEPVAEPADAASILLGEAPPPAVESPHILRFPAEAAVEPKEAPPAAHTDVAEEPQVTPSPAPEPPVEEQADSKFAVLPPPEPVPEKVPVVAPPEVEPIAAFNPDQPPPLKVQEPAAAVAVLHATVPAAQEQPAIGMATASVQPPRMFRPMVLPPPIAGFVNAPSVNLAPTLSGSVAPVSGLISLAPEAAPAAQSFSAPPRPVEPPPPPEAVRAEATPVEVPQPAAPPPAAAEPPPVEHRESVPTLKNFVRRFFPSSLTAPEPEFPPAADAPVATPPEVDEARKVTVPPAAFAPPPAPAPELVTPPSIAAAPKAEEASKVTVPPVALTPPPTPAPSPVAASPAAPTSTPPAAPPAALAPAPAPPIATADVPFQLPLPPLPQATPTAPPSPQHAPPSLPISRLDQSSLQALFMTEETLDLAKISRLAAALPGLQACTIVARGETFSSGNLPEGFHLNALRGLSPQVGAAADRLPIGNLKNFTLYGEQYSVSFFERPSVCLCAIHRSRSFVPGVREKLVAVVDELARG